jgi:DNA-binding HxlR family transcriptional regulator
MSKRKLNKTTTCPVARVVDVIGDRWSLMIIRDAFDGVRRFGAFQKSLGAARNILAARLRRLVEEGILQTVPASDGTSYLEYVLTPKGLDLFKVLVGLRQWGEDHLYRDGEWHSLLVEQTSGQPVPKLTLHDADGRPLAPDQTRVQKEPPGAAPPMPAPALP